MSPGVTVTLTGTSVVTGAAITPVVVTTDSSGNYTFPNLVPGVYTITETQPTGYFDGKEQNGTPAATVGADKFAGIDLTKSAATSTGFNFGEQKASSLAGVVYQDTNNSGTQDTGETGIGGATIKLTGNDNRRQAGQLDGDHGGRRNVLVHQPAVRDVHDHRDAAGRVRGRPGDGRDGRRGGPGGQVRRHPARAAG